MKGDYSGNDGGDICGDKDDIKKSSFFHLDSSSKQW